MPVNESSDQDELLALLHYGKVVWARKWLLAAVCAAAMTAALVISLMLPRYYRSETVILAISSESGGLGSALSSSPLAGAFAAASGIQTPADRVMVLLKSRTIAEDVIGHLGLMEVFYAKHWDAEKKAWKDPENHPVMQDAVKYLRSGVAGFRKSKEGSITITVEWKDPKLAADIANYYVTVLTSVMNAKSINTTIQTVDRAVPAERKSRPRIKLNMLLAGGAALFLGLMSVLVLDYVQRIRSDGSQRNDRNLSA